MDHLPPRIDNGGRPKVHFYAARRIYKPTDFVSLPTQYGYTDLENLLENGLSQDMDESRAHEFLQSWLFFALLSQVLDQPIDSNDFWNSVETTLHTKELNTILRQWARREKEDIEEKGSDWHLKRYVRASTALECAKRFISKHLSYDRHDCNDRSQNSEEEELAGIHARLDDKLTLSLAILGETLQEGRLELVSSVGSPIKYWKDPRTEERSWGYSIHSRHQMQALNWCPNEIRIVESTFRGTKAVYYVSTLKTWDEGQKHPHCTVYKCKAKLHAQGPLHMAGCNRCDSRKIPDETIIAIIEDGKTPLLTWTPRGDLVATPYDLRKEKVIFGALTHSWDQFIVDNGRDARGKNNRSMLVCQIESLQRTFNKLLPKQKQQGKTQAEPVPFWVDVLCLPRQATPKGVALNQMKDIYRQAEAVLVWDRNLLGMRKRMPKDIIEMNVRIRTSNWSQRLWTLQEAVLARNLYVEFDKGDMVSMKELEDARDNARRNLNDEYHHIWKVGHPFSPAVWKLRKGPEKRVQHAWVAAQFRKVEKPEDEPIILANILGLDVTEIERIDEIAVRDTLPSELSMAAGKDNVAYASVMQQVVARRMVKFLDLLDAEPGLGIPSGMIFLPPPRLRAEGVKETWGYEWAPKTWMSMQAHSHPLFRPLRQAAEMMQWGLKVQFPGILLHCPGTPPQSHRFWVPEHQHKWYKVVADTDGKDWQTFWHDNVLRSNEPSIILSCTIRRDRWEIGVLVHTKGKLSKGEVRWVKKLCRVWVRLETNPNITRDLATSFRENHDTMLLGEVLQDQKWCVDGGKNPGVKIRSML